MNRANYISPGCGELAASSSGYLYFKMAKEERNEYRRVLEIGECLFRPKEHPKIFLTPISLIF